MGFGRGRGRGNGSLSLQRMLLDFYERRREREGENELVVDYSSENRKNGKQQKNGFGNSKRLKKTSGGAARPGKSLVRLLPYPGQKRSARNDSTP